MPAQQTVSLRPTVIVGLGGQGTRITVALKARLEERFADQTDYSYQNIIRFMCIDTSKESFEAVPPNRPDLGPTIITPEEMVRIGDINLTDIRQSPDQSRLAALLPERLFGSQIYLGAQQIRRLGRVALLNYYDLVERKIRDAITTVMHKDNLGKRVGGSLVSNEERLRFIVICSVCGGTGSGTFIDIAYLIKDIARQLVRAKCDVLGVFLLPEALPEVSEGTGKIRVRANAYASLLDLEYFNQDVPEGDTLYKMPIGEPREIPGQPFDHAYLIQPGGKTTLRGMEQMAPIIADALDIMICTRLGEQLEATMDNIRHKFNDYHAGFRTFYSTLSVAQIVYPERWVQRQAQVRLKNAIIDRHLIGLSNEVNESIRSNTWWNNLQTDISAVLEGDLYRIPETRRSSLLANDIELNVIPDIHSTIKRLTTIKRDLENSNNPAADLRKAAETAFETFERSYRSMKEHNQQVALRWAQDRLDKAITEQLTIGWENQQGLVAIETWLLDLHGEIDSQLVRNFNSRQTFDGNKSKTINEAIQNIERVEALPFRLLKAKQEQAKKEADRLRSTIHNEWREGLTNNTVDAILLELRSYIAQKIVQIRDSIRFWKQQYGMEEKREDLSLSSAIQIVPAREGEGLEQAISNLFEDRYADARSHIPEKLFPDERFQNRAAEILDPQQHELLRQALDNWCKASISTASHDGKQSVMNFLQAETSWGKTLTDKSSPLLNYSHDVLQTRKPIEIRILGVNQIADIDSQLRDVDLNAFSKVETNDISRVTVLSTTHAIPFNALASFKEYQESYRQLLNDRNAIFHLDNDLENDPFDPSFEQFVNTYEFEGVFARALAYHWVWYNPTNQSYHLTDIFYQVFSEVIDAQTNEWERLRTKVGARTDLPDFRRLEEEYEKAIEALQNSRSTLKPLGREFISEARDRSQVYMLTRKDGMPISNLSDAFLTIYRNTSPMFARLFLRAVIRLEKELLPHSRLSAVNRLKNEWQGSDMLRQGMFLGGATNGVLITDEPLLRRLLLQLKAYYQLETKTQRMNMPRYIWWQENEETTNSTADGQNSQDANYGLSPEDSA